MQNRHSRIRLRALLRGRMREMHREPEVPEAEALVEECLDCRARTTSKELAPLHSVKSGILQNACSTSQKMDADLGKWSYAHRQVDEPPSKKSKKNGDKSGVAMLKIARQMVCVFQDMEPPKSSSILRKSSNIRKPIDVFDSLKPWHVMLTFETKIHRSGIICPSDPHQRNPSAPKFEDRSQEETEWQERCAREAAWKLAKKILKLSEKDKTALFSPSENRCVPAPSTLKLEERICCGLQSVDAHDQQKDLKFCCNGYFDEVV